MDTDPPQAAEESAWLERVAALIDQAFERLFPDELPEKPEDAVATFNRMLHFGLELSGLREQLGLSPSRAEFRQIAIQSWQSTFEPVRIGQLRSLISEVLYRNDFRLPTVGAKDSRMQAAMDAAEVFARTIRDIDNDGDDGDSSFIAAFEQHFDQKVRAERDDYETVRKSIKRFKDGAAGQVCYRLNLDTFRLEIVGETDRTHGAKRGRGRPRKEKFG